MKTPQTNSAIAFIGIGLMGSRMATRLLQAGYDVVVNNRSPEKCEPLADHGARIAGSVADAVADADFVLTSLAGAGAIESVYFGEGGIAAAAPAGCRREQSPSSRRSRLRAPRCTGYRRCFRR